MIDAYEGMGEFHDLFMTDVWGGLRPVLASAFADLSQVGLRVAEADERIGIIRRAEARP